MSVVRLNIASLQKASLFLSPISRSIITAALLAFFMGNTYLYQALGAPVNKDERAWVDRSLEPLWRRDPSQTNHKQYYYARHHPSFARLVYRFTLHSIGVYELNRPLVDYSKDIEYNLVHGAYPPLEIETPLRLVNVAFLAAMVAFVYLGLKRITGSRALSMLGCLPVIYSPSIYAGACPYLGADSMLLFWLAAFWYTWLCLRDRGAVGILGLGLVGGLMVSTKVNGAFVLLGAGLYYLFAARGMRRLLFPAALALIPFAVFIAMNPVYRAGDLGWMAKSLVDTIRLMFVLKERSQASHWAGYSRIEILRSTFPYWFFYLPVAAIIHRSRRRPWFGVTLAWAAPTVLLNWLLIYMPFPRYAAPIELAFLVLLAATGLPLIRDTFLSGTASPEDVSREAAS